MKKARYIGKTYGTGYDRNMIYLEYEYRGKRYEVYENRAKGNEPLAWQHAAEQAKIDELIEQENTPQKPYRYEDTAEYGMDLFWELIEEQ